MGWSPTGGMPERIVSGFPLGTISPGLNAHINRFLVSLCRECGRIRLTLAASASSQVYAFSSKELIPRCATLHGGLVFSLTGGMPERIVSGLSRLLPQLPRHGLGPIASGQHPSVVTKHDQSPGILLDAGSVD
jgi:hypothetical protein